MKQRLSTSTRILFATCLSAFCLVALSTQAATITVINTNDSGAGSLRQALADVNDGDSIEFDSSLNGQTITLTTGQLIVNNSVTITGPGPANLAVDGNAADRVFYISPGKTATISGLTITNGSAFDGGGIYNNLASLTVSDCTVSGNSSTRVGGGILNYGVLGSAMLTVTNSTIGGNSAVFGGGILNFGWFGSATLTVNSSTLSGNGAEDMGGGILNMCSVGSATMTFNNSTLSENLAYLGGGIYNVSTDGSATTTLSSSTLRENLASFGGGIGNHVHIYGNSTLTVSHCTISGNSANVNGGGIYNYGDYDSATLTLNNSTVSDNSASFNGGGICNDGIYDDSATLTINSSTLSGNSAGNAGGGIYVFGTLTVRDAILNAGSSGENIHKGLEGVVTSLGYNLSSDAGGGWLTGPGDQINTDPLLGPLQDNGGPTFTHALLNGSPAIDAGDPNFDPYDCDPPLLYDQRGPGFDRVLNNRIDIGAFEAQGVASVCPQPKGYWKSNPDAWPVNELRLGSQTYSETELLILLNTPVGSGRNADASLILAGQLIAAKLNVANGSDPAPISDTITDADGLLSGFSGKLPYQVKTSTTTGQQMVTDANVLESYNNGALTTGCAP